MSPSVPTKDQIQQAIERLRPDQLARLWEFILNLSQEPVAPLYRVHEHAIRTGISDLAAGHTRYLYGQAPSSPDTIVSPPTLQTTVEE
jgi:hypothetical protein